MKDALTQTLLARVYDVAIESPLELARHMSAEINNNVYLKREDLQPVHSFKLRGAYNKIAHLSAKQRAKGVIAASAGNHAQGVALSAQRLGIKAVIVMPKTTPQIKTDAVVSYGAKVVLYGDNYSEAYDHCQTLIKETGMEFVHPFDDPLVIAGQGTIGREIIEQQPDVTHIFIPVGGGGLLGGVAQYVKQLRPDIKIIGVEPDDSNAMQASLKAGKRISLAHVGIFADGVAVKEVGKYTFELAKKYADEIITVNNDQLCAAIKTVFEETRTIAEPAGALALAGAKAYAKTHKLTDKHLVAICSGANMTFEKLQFIAERTLLGSGNEALFAVKLAEQPGALQRFVNDVVNGHSITEFSYRLHDREQAHIFVGITVNGQADKTQFTKKMAQQDYKYTDLTDDETAKEHIRHMIGGPSSQTRHEHVYQINFPERPGALSVFLRAIGARWNICLFHYRGQGGDTGKVLIGFETTDKSALEAGLSKVGYEFEAINSKAIDIFL
ncbi:MAG TPA: threonine ammonia-lyase, biosynthetic [Candidatus Limnocylindrales bacterium]|nr:threonine ammonia-lyase, biosynthetic [Candidatus Limnocylindrales bacterium]